MLELNDFKVEFSPFGKCLPKELTFINPDIQWTSEELCRNAVDESWHKDEMSEEGYFALKILFFRIMVPKEHWNDVEYEKFLNIVQTKYRSRLEEE